MALPRWDAFRYNTDRCNRQSSINRCCSKRHEDGSLQGVCEQHERRQQASVVHRWSADGRQGLEVLDVLDLASDCVSCIDCVSSSNNLATTTTRSELATTGRNGRAGGI